MVKKTNKNDFDSNQGKRYKYMLHIGKMADYALLITNQLVATRNQLSTTEALADATQLPLATVRKLLKQLVDTGIVKSQRGIKGGYTLAKDPALISIADVLTAIEGPISLTKCVVQQNGCELSAQCSLKSNWGYLNGIVTDVLQQISVFDMSENIAAANESLQLIKLSNATRPTVQS